MWSLVRSMYNGRMNNQIHYRVIQNQARPPTHIEYIDFPEPAHPLENAKEFKQ